MECGAGWFVQEYDWFSKLTGCAADGALEGAKGGEPAKLEEGTDPAMLGVLPWTYGTPLNEGAPCTMGTCPPAGKISVPNGKGTSGIAPRRFSSSSGWLL